MTYGSPRPSLAGTSGPNFPPTPTHSIPFLPLLSCLQKKQKPFYNKNLNIYLSKPSSWYGSCH